jgi:hypothetical protein
VSGGQKTPHFCHDQTEVILYAIIDTICLAIEWDLEVECIVVDLIDIRKKKK